MRTKQEVFAFCQDKCVNDAVKHFISGYCQAQGMKVGHNNIKSDPKGHELTIKEFIEWFKNKSGCKFLEFMNCLKGHKISTEPKFKKGDYIVSSTGLIAIFNSYKAGGVVIYDCVFGEHLGPIIKRDIGIGLGKSCRLATLEEAKKLDNALAEVGKFYNKETKQIEDTPKRLKEEFEEWKAKHKLISITLYNNESTLKLTEKLRDIRELCLFSKFINNGEESRYAIITHAGHLVIRECSAYQALIDKLFSTEQKAQQAIEVLGEDLIRTALSSDF